MTLSATFHSLPKNSFPIALYQGMTLVMPHSLENAFGL
jgi:hypothetical protein